MSTESLAEIELASVPACALRVFRERSTRNNDSGPAEAAEFTHLYVLQHPVGMTYIAHHCKTLRGLSEQATYLVDVHENDVAGVGEISFYEGDRSFVHTPFVAWTQTSDAFRGQGLGRRRLLLMNLVSMTLYGQPLWSGALRCHEAVNRAWNRLVQDGLAEHFRDDFGYSRYRFLGDTQ